MTWSSRSLLAAVLLTGFAPAATAARYTLEAGTKSNILGHDARERVSERLGLARGQLDTALQNRLELTLFTGLISIGPITEAFMTTWSHRDLTEVSLMPFLKTLSTLQAVSFEMSDAQARHVVEGDWMVVVRSGGYAAAQFTGHTTSCAENDRSVRVCQVDMSRSGQGGTERKPSSEREMFMHPFVPSLWVDPAANRLCLRIRFDPNRNERHVVAVDFSAPEAGAASRATVGEPGPSREFTDACSPAGKALVAAFAAGHVQITVATSAAPGAEYISRFVFVTRMPDRPLLGRSPLGLPLDLH